MTDFQTTEEFVKISLTTARYILVTTRNLVSWLHGSDYDPETGRMSETSNEIPSLYEAQDKTDIALHQWLGDASSILKMIAGIVSFELARINEAKSHLDTDFGSDDDIVTLHDGRRMPPAIRDSHYDDWGYDRDDEASPEILYGAQDEKENRDPFDGLSEL